MLVYLESPFPSVHSCSHRVRLKRYRTSGLSLPTGNIAAFMVSLNFARWGKGTFFPIKAFRNSDIKTTYSFGFLGIMLVPCLVFADLDTLEKQRNLSRGGTLFSLTHVECEHTHMKVCKTSCLYLPPF